MAEVDRSAASDSRHPVPLMEGLRNLTKGYDRKFALSYCADDVWAALEALERIEDASDGESAITLKSIAKQALRG